MTDFALVNARHEPTPFVKWPGGKRAIMNTLVSMMPTVSGTYWEPFVGAGAVFFHGWRMGKFDHASLSDVNDDLIAAYIVIRDRLSDMIDQLKYLSLNHSKESFYKIRKSKPKRALDRAARLVYLNRYCFNGMQRVNRHGEFNVPIGKYEKSHDFNFDNMRIVKQALQGVELEARSFDSIAPRAGDFVYCDPPYHGGFVDYTSNGFDENDQLRLRDKCLEWADAGANVIISNSDTSFIRRIYEPSLFRITEIGVPRRIGGVKDRRNDAHELIMEIGHERG